MVSKAQTALSDTADTLTWSASSEPPWRNGSDDRGSGGGTPVTAAMVRSTAWMLGSTWPSIEPRDEMPWLWSASWMTRRSDMRAVR